MPSQHQMWWHSCCSVKDLTTALDDVEITAIETDIVYSPEQEEVVMAHPPVSESDLTFENFMERCVEHASIRHLKLDFKEERVVDVSVKKIKEKYLKRLKDRRQGLWLNADVLAGPGCAKSRFDPDLFVRTCVEKIPDAVLSLGWRIDLGVGGAYDDAHVDAMLALLKRHQLLVENARTRVVVTANLRLAVLEDTALARILDETPCELLLWTGFGEPSISQADLDTAVRLFGGGDRLGFDVSLARSTTFAIAAHAAFRIFRLYAFVKAKSTNLATNLLMSRKTTSPIRLCDPILAAEAS